MDSCPEPGMGVVAGPPDGRNGSVRQGNGGGGQGNGGPGNGGGGGPGNGGPGSGGGGGPGNGDPGNGGGGGGGGPGNGGPGNGGGGGGQGSGGPGSGGGGPGNGGPGSGGGGGQGNGGPGNGGGGGPGNGGPGNGGGEGPGNGGPGNGGGGGPGNGGEGPGIGGPGNDGGGQGNGGPGNGGGGGGPGNGGPGNGGGGQGNGGPGSGGGGGGPGDGGGGGQGNGGGGGGPGNGGPGNDGGGLGNGGPGNGGGGPGSSAQRTCNALKTETTCAGGIGGDNETGDCFWCADTNMCRNSEEECPGRGRGNPCRNLQEKSSCEATTACMWCLDLELCMAARGNGICFRANHNGTMPGYNDMMGGSRACPLLENAGNCTANVNCRWCENDSMCKRAEAACSDGSAGVRGNPCQDAESEEECPSGCMWCVERSECRRASNFACSVDDFAFGNGNFTGGDGNFTGGGNVCRFLDEAPDCNAIEECQWCDAQSRCKLAQANCSQAADIAGIELEEIGAMFAVQDDGLGPTDPDAVLVALDYLFEVAENGTIIEESLVDFEFQPFDIRQAVGNLIGIAARKITFESMIEGVGTIVVEAFVMLEAGMILADTGETWSVQEGDIKFNILMSNWTFCDAENPCGDSALVSEFVDVAVKIQGSNTDPEPSEIDSMLFNLGGNVPLTLSDQIMVDDFVQTMPDGFPRAENTEEQGTVFVFRFPRFITALEYDPSIGFHVTLNSDDTTTGETLTEAPVTAPTEGTILVPDTPAPSKLDDSTQAPFPALKEEEEDKSKEPADNSWMSIGALVGIIIGGLCGFCCCCAGIGLATKTKKDGASIVKHEASNRATYLENFEDEGLLGDEENQKNVIYATVVGVIDDASDDDDDDDDEETDDDDEEDESEEEEGDDNEDESEEADNDNDDDDEDDDDDESEEEDSDEEEEDESQEDDDGDEEGSDDEGRIV